MSTAARIEELRKKFDENPRRYFAPLANELRKAGELTQAIALCREHLPKQPGHMSGYIVFGQALFEVGELNEARVVFEQALALDPENLIALHHLGHIARQTGDVASARRWYERALETDPRNDDIAHQLAALATPVRAQPAIPTPAAASAIDPDRELAFLEAGIIQPRRDLGAIPTPPVPHEAIEAVPLAPTPDASMRAVDFDFVNATLAGRPETEAQPQEAASADEEVAPAAAGAFAMANEPIDLSFDESVAEPLDLEPAVPGGSPVDASPVGALPDTALDAALDTTDVVAESVIDLTVDAAPTASAQALADDPFSFAEDEFADATLGADGAVAPIDLDAAFEEGLVTAGWPDASELAAVSTPRSVTPASVDVTIDAVEAFGREPEDPVVVPLPEPEPEVLGEEADLPTPYAAVDAVAEVHDDTATAPVHAVQADVEPAELERVGEQPVVEAAAEEAVPALDSVAEVAELTTEGDAQGDLPWLAAPVTPTEDVTAIMHALEEDARASGEPDDVSMFALPAAAPQTEEASAAPESDETSFVDVRPVPEFEDTYAGDDQSQETAQSSAFVTETMGELFVAQGFVDRAVTVYEELVRRRPYDPVLSARLTELREQLAAAAPVSVYTARERYATLAARRVVRRTPVRPYTPIATPAVSATPLSVTPQSLTPMAAPPAIVRTPTPMMAPVVNADESLASLFGAESRAQDDFAAQALADAFAPVPLESAPADTFATSFLGTPEGARTPTPAYGAVRQPTPAMVPPVPSPAPTESEAEFSFDRFFPDPAASATPSQPAAAAPESAPATGEPSAGDDLAQFSAWLKGLGQS